MFAARPISSATGNMNIIAEKMNNIVNIEQLYPASIAGNILSK